VVRVEQTAYPGPGEIRTNASGMVQICDAASGALLHVLGDHCGEIRCPAFDPDGRHLVTGSTDRTARVGDADACKEVGTERNHRDRVAAVAFTPTGRLTLSADADTKVRVWDQGAGPGGKR
jgi:WD40 repeat protein